MDEKQVFILTDHALESVVKQIEAEQWQLALPDEFMTWSREPLTLRKLVNYLAYDEAWIPNTLSGKTMEEVGKDRFDGDLLKDDPLASYSAYVQSAVQAVEACDDLDKITHLSYGEFPAREYLQHITLYRAGRAVDLAKFLQIANPLTGALAQALYDQIKPHAEDYRAMKVLPAEVPTATNASIEEKLLGLMGRL